MTTNDEWPVQKGCQIWGMLTDQWPTPCRCSRPLHLDNWSMECFHRNAAYDVYRNRKPGEPLGAHQSVPEKTGLTYGR